eukprot:gene7693-9463_t
MTDFDWAVKNGDLEGVKKMIAENPSLVNTLDANKRNPCHWAADFNQPSILEFLISKKAKFDESDGYGITPLLAAVYEGHKDVVAILVKSGASKTVKGPDDKTPFESSDNPEIKALLK